MISLNDIYFKIDSNIVSQGFWELDIEKKKKLIDTELRKYLISKIQETNSTKVIGDGREIDFSVECLVQILASNIPQHQHFETLRHLTHYIVQVAGTLQNWSITWWEEKEKELIEQPLIEFDENGLWTSLRTHEKTDYVKTFNFVYDVFYNNFMLKNTSQKRKSLDNILDKEK